LILVAASGLSARVAPAGPQIRPAEVKDAPSPTAPDLQGSRGAGSTKGIRIEPDELVTGSLSIDRWAIIVGISKYQHEGWNLNYADRDAEALYELLQTGTGGGFAKDHILKLTNAEATTAAITRALRSFLKRPAKDDVVLLYFSCHGVTDPERPGIVYVMTHDTDPADISGTALPMREINLCLQDYLLSERTVIIADTCHSAAIGGPGRRSTAGPSTAAVNEYLLGVSRARKGTALLTSAEATEVALEDEKWGGGHGVFTHFLLEGMRGGADRIDPDGVVTLGELFEFVRQKVIDETGSHQHPTIGTTPFDRRFPMAITGGLSAQIHYELGCQLYKLGQELDERRPFVSAAQHLGEAQRLFRTEAAAAGQARANRMRGLALLADGRATEAARALTDALEQDPGDALPDVPCYLGVAQAKMGDHEAALKALGRFVGRHPDDEKAPWTKHLMAWLEDRRGGGGKRYALLIGCTKYPGLDRWFDLAGPGNDVLLLEQLLIRKYRFMPENIVKLTERGDAAHLPTRANIERELHSLKERATRKDLAIIYFGGHATTLPPDEYALLPSDVKRIDARSKDKNRPLNIITYTDLDREIVSLPTRTTLILDATPPRVGFGPARPLPHGPRYTAILANQPGSVTAERRFPPGEVGAFHGVFTYYFVKELLDSDPGLPIAEVLSRVASRFRDSGRNQVPMLLGDSSRPFLYEADLLKYFDICVRPRSLQSIRALEPFYGSAKADVPVHFPDLHEGIGRAFLERGQFTAASNALTASLEQSRAGSDPSLTIHLGIARLRLGRYEEAADLFEASSSRVDPGLQETLRDATTRVHALTQQGISALLVGIDDYKSQDIADLRGAVNDVDAWRRLLEEKFNGRKLDIKILTNREATREAIHKEFEELVRKAGDGPALFYFAGYGSRDERDAPTIVSFDARDGTILDIRIDELATLARNDSTNFVAIIDVGWTDVVSGSGDRSLAPDTRPKPRERGGLITTDPDAMERIGRHSIFQRRPDDVTGNIQRQLLVEEEIPPVDGSMGRKVHGKLTDALIQSLSQVDLRGLTYARWIEAASNKINARMPRVGGEDPREAALAQAEAEQSSSSGLRPLLLVSENPAEVVFGNTVAEQAIASRLLKAQREPFKRLTALLKVLLDRRPDLAAEAYLDLGIADAFVADDASIAHFEKALERIDPANRSLLREAHYHLGRVLFENRKDLNRAVSELDRAVAHDPGDARALYYRGQAVRTLIEQDLLRQAEKDLRKYLASGAPIGQQREVEQFLELRSAPRAQPVPPGH